MPQDSLRSVVYRSFVTCDDPKGVVECKKIRKSKKMEDKTKNQRIKQDSNASKSYEEERSKDKVPRESTEEIQNMSSVQIMEVSRGAEKLNEVIDLWSNRTSFDKQSKCIAKDLLKGALDLQESLAMLGKLQEASRHIAKSKRGHKEKLVEGRADLPFGDCDQAMDFQKPRISADGSSRDCYDELREVIRESFARQNLLPKVSAKEKNHIDGKNVDLCMDFPSSSSSQSSLLQSHSSSCSPSKVQNEKLKGPNLIAKLMGLEEVPPKAVNPIIYKQMEKEKVSSERNHLLDIDLPRPRKPQFMVQKVVQERRTLEEMIETMQFKGLLGRKSIDGKDRFDDPYMRRSSSVEGTPIVLMRPRHVRDHRAEEFLENYWGNEEKPIKSRQMPGKLREEFPLYASEVPKRQWKFVERNEKLRAKSPPKQKLSKDKEDKHSGESHARLVDKTLDIQYRLSTMKIKHSKPPVPRLQKDEVIVKKIGNTPKGASSTRKQTDVKDAKSLESVKNQDLGENTTLNHGKIARGSIVSKCQIALGKAPILDKPMKPTSLKSTSPKKNLRKAKSDSKPSAALVENVQNDDRLPPDIESDIQRSLVKSTTCVQVA
ncbi:hypothetical protein CDL12_09176 [Handroanthus impetiginosus]|uniref:DUF3741 domain-containing protein n=1 Tax=Handroanthus impetiginosus TaxID=429701 RepID=A0A2G9HL46_9LAMI|nr:hypothetical protein CDL12_09176 [Handroanthus impetiginosus]